MKERGTRNENGYGRKLDTQIIIRVKREEKYFIRQIAKMKQISVNELIRGFIKNEIDNFDIRKL